MKSNNGLRNFEIKQKLGSGSYGVIFKAINKTDKSTCVLKQISLTRMSEKAKKNAVNEATIMGKLKHPFIVCYYESFTEDSNLNIVMEYCDGGDLSQFLKVQNKKFLKEDKIWKLFIQICMGLEHIHKNKILHRDIKTLNIFLHQGEMVKIGDLGVAKMLNSNDFAHTMVGTPFYLSPQLCEEKPYNQKSDIWALGCLLYELCTFKHPFQAANQASLILKIIRGKYLPIPEFYSKQLRDMIDWCLERDYKRRPTASMILAKQYVKGQIEEFQLQKIVDDFSKKAEVVSTSKAENKVEKVNKTEKGQSKQKCSQPMPIQKVMDEPKKIILPPPRSQRKADDRKPAKSHKFLKEQVQKEKPKILFGGETPENKLDFINQLQSNIKEEVQKPKQDKFKVESSKKPSTYFQIPWKNEPAKVAKPQISNNEEDKIVVHNRDLLLDQDIPKVKVSEPVQRVKMEKKVEAKVYEIQKPERPKAIIKSGGFSQEQTPNVKSRKNSESDLKKQQQLSQRKSREINNSCNSLRNIKKQPEQKQEYIAKKRPSVAGITPHYPPSYPPKAKKSGGYVEQKAKASKNHPHGKLTSMSRYTEVTKQQQELVANLPDIIKKQKSSSESDEEGNNGINRRFQLNEVNHQIVLQRYEEMTNSQPAREQKINDYATNQQEENHEVEEELLQQYGENEEQALKQQEWLDQEMNERWVEEAEDQACYEVNNYPAEVHNEQWPYDEEPELPMLEETEVPLFEEANPYLVEEKAEEDTLQGKKAHLQIKLKENLKHEDELNRLMQLKIDECRSVVPKGFEEILQFFRSKINMDREYTDEDEKEVEMFLSRRNLTDQRKFQNIYKIMHFQMELDNTRKIIQSICKKLNELE